VRVFELPDLGEGLADAELVRWLVAVGDTVVVDQPIAEVETAKSVVEVPSPFAGVVAACHGEEGETIMVGSPLLEVEEGEVKEEEGPAGSGQVLVGYGTTELATARRRGRAAARTATTVGAPSRIVPVVSPVVRALAHTHGIELASLTPTGAGGVVTRRDVEAALAAASVRPAVSGPAASGPAVSGPAAPAAPAETGNDTDTEGGVDRRTGLRVAAVTPFSRLRRTVAETMTRSRSEIPEATVWVDVDATELWEARRALGRSGRPPSMLAFVARFAVSALARHPELAGRVTAAGDGVETFDGVNLGFAADTPRGLLVPVIRGADRLSIRALDAELARLAAAAREGALPPAELTGSTFTVNNYGSLGVDGSAAIINHPEVAILGIGRVMERPWVVEGAVVPRRLVQLSLVFDHRVTDGGVAARFLREIADAIESPISFLADEAPGTVRS
jgi:pyruvate dehydrogenase E2 component (dihydrolipoamide acetyltransferase)